MQFPRLLVVRQNFPDRRIPDVAAEVHKQLGASAFTARLKPGSRIAIGVGSRGIHNIATIVRNVVEYWKSKGMRPFLFPAMGSHGAASAAGQADVLFDLFDNRAANDGPVCFLPDRPDTSEVSDRRPRPAR